METSRLAVSPLFAGIPEGELEAVARAANEIEVETASALTTEGEFGHALFVVEAGSADVTIDGATVGTVGPGDVVGEIAVLASGRRTASVVATSPMRVLALFKRDVWALERDAPEAAQRLRAALDAHRAASSSVAD
jgi:CRP/FNR family cyclic AMP-dependent transcriptional regulator